LSAFFPNKLVADVRELRLVERVRGGG
jgi:hypothetical protein